MSHTPNASRPEAALPVSRQDLASYFLNGVKDPSDLQVGVEWEKIGVLRENGRAIPYSGPRGVEAIFGELSRGFGWEPDFENGHAIALRKAGSSITLEPGGQIELSGRKARSLDENATELYVHLSEIHAVSSRLGIVWLGTGHQPFSPLEEIEWVPKERYAIMREVLAAGAATPRMMKQTASIQISVDYTGERDAAEKLRLAMALAPVFTAVFGNSPFADGRLTGALSERARVWLDTAPERSGVIPSVFREDFGIEDYVEHLLTVPALFIRRVGNWIPLGGRPFGEFLKNGFEGHRATSDDWELHLTTIFTEARLKTYVEIRSVDCQKTEIGLSVPAFVKGIFYDADARAGAWDLMKDWTAEERLALAHETPVSGLATPIRSATVLDTARELVSLARMGLDRLAEKDPDLSEDATYLEPLEHMIRRGKNPAELLIQRLAKGVDADNRLAAMLDYSSIA